MSRGFLWHRRWRHPHLGHPAVLASAAVLSLVLWVPLVWCYFNQGAVGCIWKIAGSATGGERAISIVNVGGIIDLHYDDAPGGPFPYRFMASHHGPLFWWSMPYDPSWGYLRRHLWSVSYDHATSRSGVISRTVHFPSWVLLMLCAIAPSPWIRRRLRRERDRGRRGFEVEMQEASVQSR
jgi:hypothetical protein